jgi:hypothetical protein
MTKAIVHQLKAEERIWRLLQAFRWHIGLANDPVVSVNDSLL